MIKEYECVMMVQVTFTVKARSETDAVYKATHEARKLSNNSDNPVRPLTLREVPHE